MNGSPVISNRELLRAAVVKCEISYQTAEVFFLKNITRNVGTGG